MAKKATRKTVKWNGRVVVLPKGVKKLDPKLRNVIDRSITDSDWVRAGNPDNCRVVFWTKTRVGVRCKNRNLKKLRSTVGKRVAQAACRKGGAARTGKQKFRAMQFKKC